MVGLIIVLLLAWLALSVLGAVIKGLFWLMIVGVVLFLATSAYAAVRQRRGSRIDMSRQGQVAGVQEGR
jgi:uncharacterized membrane protein